MYRRRRRTAPVVITTRPKTYRRRPRRTDYLTGGTRDVNPQWFKGRVTQTGADTCSETNFQLPITRIPTANKVTIVEVLKVRVTPRFDNWDITNVELQQVSAAFCTRSVGTTPIFPDNVACFAYLKMQGGHIAAGGGHMQNGTMEQNLTDENGHGLLIASDKLYVQLDSNATTRTQDIAVEILYRFKTVGMREYVGIVQSQQ